ncbi:hypothetical protein EIN_497710 [Entamoeba invadens IP1]|uniref:Uncharacterized protein n=1 Tax=Entamoeba invadens IP1 TaxID=370355 RepID=A0A0A1UDH8_ENTIV|nr:hypothetical protein EIN_497710 [Entamoeba invadens IP1]ELP94601.1 hypothetical protein EIN_497710 [Entamoeba invadens IP1]|eukprot:XP_004261372.1 hypothetical protein EIN_497710 [Entamoeba invadens IP1]
MTESPINVEMQDMQNGLHLEPNVEDGYDYIESEESNNVVITWFVCGFFFPPLFLYTSNRYKNSENPFIHKWYKIGQNVFGLECCALFIAVVMLFSWWLHDAY